MNGVARLMSAVLILVVPIALLVMAEGAAWGYECPQTPPPGPTEDYQGLHGAVFELDGRSMPYRFFIPEGYDPATRYPLVLYLHHSGLSGTHQDNDSGLDNCVQLTSEAGSGGYGGVFLHESQTVDGQRFAVQEKYPHILVAPHANEPNFGFGGGNAGSIDQPEHFTRALVYGILDAIRTAYSVDARRIYVTGISMGCYGVWDMIMRNPGYFAAASPQSCRGDPNKTFLAPLVDMPIWSMCGSNDSYVNGARAMAAVFEELGSSQFQYLEMPGVGHSINNRGYDLPGFIDWMFAQSLPGEDPVTEDGDDAVEDNPADDGASTEPPPELTDTTIVENPTGDRPGSTTPTDLGSNPEGPRESADDSDDGLSMPADGEVNQPSFAGVPPTSSRASAGGCALAHRRAPAMAGTALLLAALGLALARLRRSRARGVGYPEHRTPSSAAPRERCGNCPAQRSHGR
jgi:dienelactone hydrolase